MEDIASIFLRGDALLYGPKYSMVEKMCNDNLMYASISDFDYEMVHV